MYGLAGWTEELPNGKRYAVEIVRLLDHRGFVKKVVEPNRILLPLKVRPPLRHNEHLKGGGEMGQHSDKTIERWTAKRRAILVLKVLKGEMSVVEASRQHGLKVAEVEHWQDQYLRAWRMGCGRAPKTRRL